MATRIGISRVAVWKAIQGLNSCGYTITSSPAGYILEKDMRDSLQPWEFGSDETRFLHLEDTESTMTRAFTAALNGAADGFVVTTERQSAGRGTGNKTWHSAPGDLLCTVVTRPHLIPAYAWRQMMAAQCAMVRAIRSVSDTEALIGWPNDILIPNAEKGYAGKAVGLLAEYVASGNDIRFFNLGTGVNTGTKRLPATAAAVKAGRKNLLQEFLSELQKIKPEDSELAAEWNSRCIHTGKPISYQQKNETHTGVFQGIDAAGWAIINDCHFPPGDITIREKGRLS